MARVYITAAIYVAGAMVYYLLLTPFDVTFEATPFIFGVILLIAAPFRPRVLASAVLLLAWGAAVLALHDDWLPNRPGPVYIGAFGLAATVLRLLSRWVEPRVALENVAVVMLSSGVFFYFAFEIEALNRAWFWSIALLVNTAALVAYETWKAHRATHAQAARVRPASPLPSGKATRG